MKDYLEIIKKDICDLKRKGVSFHWNGFDLSDILISELIVTNHSSFNSLDKKISFKDHIKWFFYFEYKRLKNFKIYRNRTFDVLVFVNEPNQWEVFESICKILESNDLKIVYLTTKENIFNTSFLSKTSKSLVAGHSLFSFKILYEKNKQISQVINRYFPKITFLCRYFKKLFDSNQIKYVLIGNDATYEGRLLSKIANSYKIKVGTVQHGSLNRLNPVRGLSIVDHYFVFGKTPANELHLLGKKKEEIFISGWPLQHRFKEKLKALKKKNLSSFASDLLICLSGPGHSVDISTHLQVVNSIKQLQKKYNLKVIIKLHPKDKKDYYEGFNKVMTIIVDNVDLNKLNVDLVDLFAVTKCTLTIASTAALESLLVDTPVITIDFNNKFSDCDFISDGLTYHATNFYELESAFKRIYDISNYATNRISNSNIEKYFYNFFSDDFNPNIYITENILKICAE
jgi:hypothetical protein